MQAPHSGRAQVGQAPRNSQEDGPPSQQQWCPPSLCSVRSIVPRVRRLHLASRRSRPSYPQAEACAEVHTARAEGPPMWPWPHGVIGDHHSHTDHPFPQWHSIHNCSHLTVTCFPKSMDTDLEDGGKSSFCDII